MTLKAILSDPQTNIGIDFLGQSYFYYKNAKVFILNL